MLVHSAHLFGSFLALSFAFSILTFSRCFGNFDWYFFNRRWWRWHIVQLENDCKGEWLCSNQIVDLMELSKACLLLHSQNICSSLLRGACSATCCLRSCTRTTCGAAFVGHLGFEGSPFSCCFVCLSRLVSDERFLNEDVVTL